MGIDVGTSWDRGNRTGFPRSRRRLHSTTTLDAQGSSPSEPGPITAGGRSTGGEGGPGAPADGAGAEDRTPQAGGGDLALEKPVLRDVAQGNFSTPSGAGARQTSLTRAQRSRAARATAMQGTRGELSGELSVPQSLAESQSKGGLWRSDSNRRIVGWRMAHRVFILPRGSVCLGSRATTSPSSSPGSFV